MYANPPHSSYLQLNSDNYLAAHASSVSAPLDGDVGRPAIQSLANNALDGGMSEESFIDAVIASARDTYDNILSVVWYLSPISFTDVVEGARIVNQYSSDTRASGIIRELVTQDDTHVLYRLRIEGWVVRGVSYKPPCDTYAFLLAPTKNPNIQTSQAPISSRSHRRGRLIHIIHDIAREVKTLAVYGDPMALMGPDAVTNAFALAHSDCPLMRSFSSDKDAGVAVHEHDLVLAIHHHMTVPMPNYDFRVAGVNHLALSTDTGGGNGWGQNGYGQHSEDIPAVRTTSYSTF